MPTKLLPHLLLALLLSLTACSKQESPSAKRAVETRIVEEVKPAPAAEAPPAPPAAAPAEARVAADASSVAKPVTAAGGNLVANENLAKEVSKEDQLSSNLLKAPAPDDGSRKFIRTARANFLVKEVYQAALGVEDIVHQHGGFVIKNHIASTVQRTQRKPIADGKILELSEYLVQANLQIRVPSNKTQEFLRALAPLVVFLDERHFDARDAQFDLLRQQLEYARNQESQHEMGQINGAKPALKGDLIMGRNQLKMMRDEALLRQKEFEDQVAFSTIDLQLRQLPQVRTSEIVDVDAIFKQHQPSFGAQLMAGLKNGWQGLLDLIVSAVYVWPLWLIMASIITFWRYRRAQRIAKRLAKAST
ncbi:MAG: hypothetical protein HYZ45_14555 [Burkholderiales bacterium]|nr:hypothetical protein [Burkholderiales bacterium]